MISDYNWHLRNIPGYLQLCVYGQSITTDNNELKNEPVMCLQLQPEPSSGWEGLKEEMLSLDKNLQEK